MKTEIRESLSLTLLGSFQINIYFQAKFCIIFLKEGPQNCVIFKLHNT